MKNLILVSLSVFLIGCGGGGGGGGSPAPVTQVDNTLRVPLLSPINTPKALNKKIVVIGDSIAEGHWETHGRLHPIIDLDKPNEYGQISYVLETQLGSEVLNNGIGGNTTPALKDRWNDDVLNENPDIVFVHIGINDVYSGYTEQTMKDNFTWFIQSCNDNGLQCIFATIGGRTDIDAPKKTLVANVNFWLKQQGVDVVDYLDWQSDGTGNPAVFKSGLFYDNIHPNKAGYMDYGLFIIQNSTIIQSLL